MTKDKAWQHHKLTVYHVDIDGDEARALTYHTSHQTTVGRPGHRDSSSWRATATCCAGSGDGWKIATRSSRSAGSKQRRRGQALAEA